MGNFSRETVTMLEIKNTVTEIKNVFNILLELTQSRKESVNLKIGV